MIDLRILNLDRPPPNHKLFKQKVVSCEEFSSQPSNDAKIFLFIDNEKEIVDQLKYFSSLDEIFLRKIWGGWIFPKFQFLGGSKMTKIVKKWGGLHSVLEGSYCTVNPGDLRRPPPQNCRTDTETSWKKGPGLEQPWRHSSGRPVTLIISSISGQIVYFRPPPKFQCRG
jgi:hypothetical protein